MSCYYQFSFEAVHYGVSAWGGSVGPSSLPRSIAGLTSVLVSHDIAYSWVDKKPVHTPPIYRSRLIYDFFLTNEKPEPRVNKASNVTDEIVITLAHNAQFALPCGYHGPHQTVRPNAVQFGGESYDLVDVTDQDRPNPTTRCRMSHFRRVGSTCISGASIKIPKSLDLLPFIKFAQGFQPETRPRPAGEWLGEVSIGTEIYDETQGRVEFRSFDVSLKSDDVPLERAVRGGASAVVRLGGVPIVLPAAPRTNCIELLAARELQSELATLSGLPPAPLLHEPQPPAATARIYVGGTAARLARLAHLSPLLPEEAAVVGDGAALLVFGDDVGAPNATNASVCDALVKARSESLGCNAGSFYAATLLLREHLGMRWVWPGADGIVRPAVADPHLNVSADVLSRSAPLLALRRIRRQHPANPEYLSGWLNTSVVADYAVEEKFWMIRNGLGGRKVRCHNIAAVWVAFSPSGLHSSQDSSDIVVDRARSR